MHRVWRGFAFAGSLTLVVVYLACDGGGEGEVTGNEVDASEAANLVLEPLPPQEPGVQPVPPQKPAPPARGPNVVDQFRGADGKWYRLYSSCEGCKDRSTCRISGYCGIEVQNPYWWIVKEGECRWVGGKTPCKCFLNKKPWKGEWDKFKAGKTKGDKDADSGK